MNVTRTVPALCIIVGLAGCGHGPPPGNAPPANAACMYDAGVGADTSTGYALAQCDSVQVCVNEGQHGWVATYTGGMCVMGSCVVSGDPAWSYCEVGCLTEGAGRARCRRPGPTAA